MSNKFLAAVKTVFMAISSFMLVSAPALASEADLVVPKITGDNFNYLVAGIIVSALGLL